MASILIKLGIRVIPYLNYNVKTVNIITAWKKILQMQLLLFFFLTNKYIGANLLAIMRELGREKWIPHV